MSTSAPTSPTRRFRFARTRRLIVWVLYGLMRALTRLPFRWQLALGKRLGGIARVLLPARRRIAARNIEVCFPELATGERDQLVKRHFEAVGASIAEMAMGWFGSKDLIRSLVRIEGAQHLRQALEKGKGVILFSGHFTTFEFPFPALELLCPRLCAMYKLQRNPVMNEVMQRGRGRNFTALFSKDDVKTMLRNLSRNAVVWYASDQSYGRKNSALIPFFGEPAMTNTSISRIAAISGATVLPYLSRRLPDDSGYVLSIGAPLCGFPSDDRIEDTRRLTALLEEHVRACPEQYLWIHQRFKGRPEPHSDVYRNPGSAP